MTFQRLFWDAEGNEVDITNLDEISVEIYTDVLDHLFV